jgi:hypothetical protein
MLCPLESVPTNCRSRTQLTVTVGIAMLASILMRGLVSAIRIDIRLVIKNFGSFVKYRPPGIAVKSF